MKQLFLDLEKACYNRLVNINNSIRLERSKGNTIDQLKVYRRDTDKLLSAIKTTTQYSKETYEVLRGRFINPNKGDPNDLQKRREREVLE